MTISEKFSAFVKLEKRVAVYVPGTVDVDKAADRQQAATVDEIASAFSAMFGGASCSDASGFWMSEAAGLVRENVRIVYASTTSELLDRHAADILEIVERVKSEMKQEAVSVEIGGVLYLV